VVVDEAHEVARAVEALAVEDDEAVVAARAVEVA
jgi:hypothetical protein